MRIIAGDAKGARLLSLKDKDLRPTKDRVREALFSTLGPQLPGASFLDLFAGTGANGIEALSRGAGHADFVDSNPALCEIIRKNLETTKCIDRGDIHCLQLPTGLDRMAKNRAPYDIVFADPPYGFDQFVLLLDLLNSYKLVDADSVVVLEHAKGKLPQLDGNAFDVVRIARYGDTTLAYCRRIEST